MDLVLGSMPMNWLQQFWRRKNAASSLCVANFHRHFSKAELEGDDETLERLRAEQARRDARGEHARERGVRSVGARNPRRIPR